MLNVKIIILVLLQFSILSTESYDEKYVWASKLNLRNSPNINGELIRQIERGEKVKIIDRTNIEFEVVDTLFRFYSRFEKESKRYVDGKEVLKIKTFKGKWTRVRSNGQIGFVFDFYLSKLKPIPTFKFPLGNDLKNYLNIQANYTQEKIGCQSCDDDYIRYEDEGNEVIIETGIKGKCGYLGILLYNTLKSEGELIAFNLFDNDVSDACSYSVNEEKDHVKIIYYCCC